MISPETKRYRLRSMIALLVLLLIAAAAVIIPPDSPASFSERSGGFESTDSTAADQPEAQDSSVPQTTQEASALTDEEERAVFFASALQDTMERLANQQETDESLAKELQSGAYTFEEPLVVVDPYNQSPLTAVVVFKTEEAARISVHVPGKNKPADIDFTFDAYSTDHVIPVYGLYAGQINEVVLTADSENGLSQSTTLGIETEPLQGEIAVTKIMTDAEQEEKYQQGLNFTFNANNTKTAFDINGDYRWYINNKYINLYVANYDFNGHFLFGAGSVNFGDSLFFEMTPIGKILKVMYAPYGCHHDIEIRSDGNLLMTGSYGDSIEDFIYEINTTTGEIINTMDLKTVFPRDRRGMVPAEDKDWFHLNDIACVPDSSDMIISSRHQSLVARLSWPEGEIDWILAEHTDWPYMFQKYLLNPVGMDFEWQYNQHKPVILPDDDHDPETMDVLLYDNGNQRFGMDPGRAGELYTRLVHYRINEADKTVEQIWQYGKEQGNLLYADARGNVEPLENGNYVASFSLATDGTHSATYLEIDENAQVVWQAIAYLLINNGNLIEYRVERMPIYNSSANEPLLETTAINLIPKEILEKNADQ